MVGIVAGQLSAAADQVFRRLDRPDRQGRIAHAQAEASGRRSSAMSWSRPGTGATPKKYLHDLISSDRRNPTVNGYGPLFGSPEYSTDDHPDPRSGEEHGRPLPGAGARPDMPEMLGPGHAASDKPLGAVGLLGRGEDLGHPASTITTRCSTRRAGSGWRRRSAARKNPDFCKKGSDHPSAKLFPLDQRTARWRCSIRRR